MTTHVKRSIVPKVIKQPTPCWEGVEVLAIKIRKGTKDPQVYNIYRSQMWELDRSEVFSIPHSLLIWCGLNIHHSFLGSQHYDDVGRHLAMVKEETDSICLLNSGVPTHQARGRLHI
ncbi:hypothetical protein Pmani_005135 [Petrolisthes manimaculis]|uniref:Uncharacterized protein n=1 Tax=Petrolisthes manimaculis TaxID=1843537 RepID=A0AAE1QDJ6_9EUCA|nr:hypothetical protein Pmani_005135 [Petrolisthes manimaculis]